MELIQNHPILDYKHGREVTFTFDGRELKGYEGEPIAMALHANGVHIYRITPEMKRMRDRQLQLLLQGGRRRPQRPHLRHAAYGGHEGRDPEGQRPRSFGSLLRRGIRDEENT